tara:strand:- start:1557 stop:1760 length:204 start_codon:yes stop_codon:yes gene_type:complete
MRAFVVFKVARQVQGEFVMVRTLAAFSEQTKADEFANGQTKGIEMLPTPDGEIECLCEVGVHEVEIE